MPTYDVPAQEGRIVIESVNELLHVLHVDRHMAALAVVPDNEDEDDEEAGTPAVFLDITDIDRLVLVLAQVRQDLVEAGAPALPQGGGMAGHEKSDIGGESHQAEAKLVTLELDIMAVGTITVGVPAEKAADIDKGNIHMPCLLEEFESATGVAISPDELRQSMTEIGIDHVTICDGEDTEYNS